MVSVNSTNITHGNLYQNQKGNGIRRRQEGNEKRSQSMAASTQGVANNVSVKKCWPQRGVEINTSVRIRMASIAGMAKYAGNKRR